MISNGLVEEVKNILNMGYDKHLNSLNTVGYKEIIQYLDGIISFEKAIELIKQNTRHYAKRQITWFRKDNRIKWFKLNSVDELSGASNKILDELR
jgi:tRNA dimethylallyltransferase